MADISEFRDQCQQMIGQLQVQIENLGVDISQSREQNSRSDLSLISPLGLPRPVIYEEQRAESTRASDTDFKRSRPRYGGDEELSSNQSREGLYYISRQTNEVPSDGFVDQSNCEVTPQIRNTSSVGTSVPSRVPLSVTTKSVPSSMAGTNLVQTNVQPPAPRHVSFNHPKPRILRREREPDKFDGKSVDWQDYIVHFEQTAQWNDWDDESKAQQLCMCLRGTAQKLLGDAKSNVLADYTSLKDMLSKRFAPKERITAYRCEFNSRIRRKSESIQDYGYALRRLVRLAYPDLEKTEDLAIDQFIRGLGNFDVQKRVQFSHPTTLESAIALAIEYEAFVGSMSTEVRKPKEQTEEHAAAIQSVKRSDKNDKGNTENVKAQVRNPGCGTERRPSIKVNPIKQNGLFASVKVGLNKGSFLLDTGAVVSCVSKAKLDEFNIDELKVQDILTSLTTAGGQELKVHGQVTLEFFIQGIPFTHDFVIAELDDLEGILGIDFLEANEAQINISKSLLIMPDDSTIKLHKQQNKHCALIRLSDRLVLPANTESVFQIKVPKNIKEEDMLVEPNARLVRNGILISTALVNTTKRKVAISAINCRDRDVTLKRNKVVGSIQTVKTISDSVSVNNLDNLSELPEHLTDTGNTKPVKIPPRRVPIKQREIIEQELEKMLQNDVIEPSCSPWSAPVTLCLKKDSTWRFCIDYRVLNLHTLKDSYPLPRIDSSLDSLGNNKWFSTIDLASGYWQVLVDEKDRPKTAFSCHKGLFQFKVMPFGLCNAPSCFERLMDIVLKGYQWERCMCYLDDVIIFGPTFEKALENLDLVFDRFRKASLKLKPKKCFLFQHQVLYLGHLVSDKGIACDPAKIESVSDWPVPKNVNEVRSFLGLAGYYRRFIPSFSEIASPMTNLTKKGLKFLWDQDCQNAFEVLKEKLISAPILSYPIGDGEFILDTDASGHAIGAVLSQVQDGEEKVIAYASRMLSDTQQKYCTTYRELLAVITFVKYFRHYLLGQQFRIRTDHASLIWLKNFKHPEGMVARWISVLDTYDYEIEYRKGTQHTNADVLSRKPYRLCKRSDCPACDKNQVGQSCDNPDKCLLAPIRPGNSDLDETIPYVEDDSDNEGEPDLPQISNWLRVWTSEEKVSWQDNDPDISKIVNMLGEFDEKPGKEVVSGCSYGIRNLWSVWESLLIENGLLYYRIETDNEENLVLVAPTEIRNQIMKEFHNSVISGHLGRDRTIRAIKNRFYWPGMTSDISSWVRECIVCAKAKPGPGIGRFPLQQSLVGCPFDRIGVDIVGPCPITENENEYLIVVQDYFTKWTEAFAVKNHNALTVADKLVSEIFCRNNWDDLLPYLLMAYRATENDSTGVSPHKMLTGREMVYPLDIMAGNPSTVHTPCPVEYVQWLNYSFRKTFNFAREKLSKAATRQKKSYDRGLKPRQYEENDFVFRWYPPTAGIKLGLGWRGPYKVKAKLSDVTYRIQETPTAKDIVVHVDHLKPHFGNVPVTWLPPEIEDEIQSDESDIEPPLLDFHLSFDETHETENDIPLIIDVNPCTPSPQRTRCGRTVKKPTNMAEERPVFKKGYICPVATCGQGPFSVFRQYQRHWHRKHVREVKEFSCIGCNDSFPRRHHVKEHLISFHHFTPRHAILIMPSLQSTITVNLKYVKPGKCLPPLWEDSTNIEVAMIQEEEEVYEDAQEYVQPQEYVEYGEGVPRDMEYELVEESGGCLVLLPYLLSEASENKDEAPTFHQPSEKSKAHCSTTAQVYSAIAIPTASADELVSIENEEQA
ncbi:Retrovirus-related Pol polyprotein from transposon 297 [Mytilus edulis]|uniref:Retrovirus-related Pol polyprotein from transposon 297 n=1 Tax=Mytilus edulis TaxID=6550 RepID=A0A8S3SSW8_MYTED|nr:Retrovirus-related Pol polyprotein from transposon 297 [Mytilus edulis]